jgi:hypothetical protein
MARSRYESRKVPQAFVLAKSSVLYSGDFLLLGKYTDRPLEWTTREPLQPLAITALRTLRSAEEGDAEVLGERGAEKEEQGRQGKGMP